MTPAAASQFVLEFPTHPEAPPQPRKRRQRALSAVPGVTYEAPTLTPDVATAQARAALTAAGVPCRCLSWPTTDRPGWVTTVALPRAGVDAQQVADALGGLGELWCGTAAVAVYRRREPHGRF